MADTTEVNTVFTAVDKASGPLAKMGKGAEDLAKKVAGAQKTTSAPWAIPTARAGAAGGGKPATESKREEASQAFDRDEFRLRRSRIKGLKLEEQRGDITERAAQAAGAALGAHSNVFAATLGNLAGSAEAIGFQMAAFGGSMGAAGQKIVDLAGKAGALAASFGVSYAIGTALDDWLGISDKLAGIDVDKTNKANNDYARSLGYRSAAEYSAASKVLGGISRERELNSAAAKAVASLGGIPYDKTGQAMDTWERSLLAAALKTGANTADTEEVMKRTKSLAEQSVATWLNGAQGQLQLNATLEEQGRALKGIPYKPTQEEQLRQKQALAESVVALRKNSFITDAQSSLAFERLEQMAQEKNAAAAVFSGFADEENERFKLREAVKRQTKAVHWYSESTLKGAQMNVQLTAGLAESVARTMGVETEAGRKAVLEMVKDVKTKKLELNFNNARFDIKQAFAEGFDPDRIAVAFTNDLVKLAEHGLESRLSAPITGKP